MNWEEKEARARERAQSPSRDAIRFAAHCSLVRHALRLTQVEFASRMGLHWLTVSRWERIAGHYPSQESLRRFAQMEYELKMKQGDREQRIRIGDPA